MAIAFGTAGAVATGSSSLTIAYPSSIAAGDLLICAICNKYPTNGPATPGGWELMAGAQLVGGTGSAGIDSGQTYCTVFIKRANGSESGNLSVTITSGNTATGRMFRYTKASNKGWGLVFYNGSDTSAGTGWSITTASTPALAANDVLFEASAINGDVCASWSSQAFTCTGITFGSVTERQDSGTNTGQDCHLECSEVSVSSGTPSSAITFTMTAAASGANGPMGGTVILRMREIAPPMHDPIGSMSGYYGV